MQKRKSIVLLAVLMCTLIFTGCQTGRPEGIPPQEPPPEVKIVQNVLSLQSLPLYAAIEKGCFQKANLTVAVTTTWNQAESTAKLQDGTHQIMLGGPETVFFLRQQEKNPQVLLIAQASVANGYYLLARKTQNPFAWQSLKNKIVIGCREGELPEIIFENILKKNDLRPFDSLQLVNNLSPLVTPGAYQAGTGDYLLACEPYAARLEKANTAQIVSSLSASDGTLLTSGFMVTHEFLQTNPEICREFVQALAQALHWVESSPPEELVPVAKKMFPTDDESTLLRAVSRYKNLGLWPSSPIVDEVNLQHVQTLLWEEKELNAKLSLKLLYENPSEPEQP